MFTFLYSEKRPVVHLRSYIRSYWHFRRNFKTSTKQRIHPDSFQELIWVNSGTLKVNEKIVPRMFVGGFSPSTLTLSGEGVVETHCVRFYAWGLVPFTKKPLESDELFVDAASVFAQADYDRLYEIFSTKKGKSLYAALDDFFAEYLLRQRVPIDVIAKANAFLQDTKGVASISDVAKVCQLSNRQLERIIGKATGKTPQALAARIRLEHVRKALVDNPAKSMSVLANEYGFSDQSHLNKEFKRFTGTTPLEFIEEYNATYSHLHLGNKEMTD